MIIKTRGKQELNFSRFLGPSEVGPYLLDKEEFIELVDNPTSFSVVYDEEMDWLPAFIRKDSNAIEENVIVSVDFALQWDELTGGLDTFYNHVIKNVLNMTDGKSLVKAAEWWHSGEVYEDILDISLLGTQGLLIHLREHHCEITSVIHNSIPDAPMGDYEIIELPKVAAMIIVADQVEKVLKEGELPC